MNTIIGLVLLSISVLLSSLTSVYFILFGKKSKLLYLFIYCQVLILIWSLGYIIETISTDLQVKMIVVRFEGLAICFIGFAWLIFSMEYTESKGLKKKVVGLLLVIPIISYVCMITNSYHGLYYNVFEINRRVYGIAFWIHILTAYIYVFFGTVMILKYSFKMPENEKKQSIVLIIAVTTPFITNVLYISRILKVNLDITPVTFSVSLFLFAIASFKYKFLNSVPAGLRKVFDTVEAAIILIDNTGLIVSKNSSFSKTFTEYRGNNINEFQIYLMKRMQNTGKQSGFISAMFREDSKAFYGEIKIDVPQKRVFRVVVQPIVESINRELGKLISFTDITLYRELSDELSEKNVQLTYANEQLKQHMLVVEELAALEERNRMAREIHDSLGHTLTFLVKIQEGAILDFGQNNQGMFESIKTANKVARQGLKDLRLSLYNIMPEKQRLNGLFEDLERLSMDFKNSGIGIEIINDCKESINAELSREIFRICQEAVTNSIRHGNADMIHIIIRENERILKLFIIDNGKGCIEIKKGFGLLGMEERVLKYGGSVIFGSDGESGFNIRAEVPIEGGVA